MATVGVKGLIVSYKVPRSQHPNKNVFSSRLNRWKLMSACRRAMSVGRL